MSLTGPDPEHPTKVGVPIADLLAGMNGAFGVATALAARERTGRGTVVRTSLLAAIVGVHAFQGTRWTVAGEVPQAQRQPPPGDRAVRLVPGRRRDDPGRRRQRPAVEGLRGLPRAGRRRTPASRPTRLRVEPPPGADRGDRGATRDRDRRTPGSPASTRPASRPGGSARSTRSTRGTRPSARACWSTWTTRRSGGSGCPDRRCGSRPPTGSRPGGPATATAAARRARRRRPRLARGEAVIAAPEDAPPHTLVRGPGAGTTATPTVSGRCLPGTTLSTLLALPAERLQEELAAAPEGPAPEATLAPIDGTPRSGRPG